MVVERSDKAMIVTRVIRDNKICILLFSVDISYKVFILFDKIHSRTIWTDRPSSKRDYSKETTFHVWKMHKANYDQLYYVKAIIEQSFKRGNE